MASTRDRLKQTKEKLVSPLKIYRNPNSKKKNDLEIDDPNEGLTILETTISAQTSTVGELVEQLRLTNLTKAVTLVKRRGRLKKKGVMEVDGGENVSVFDDSSVAESDEERSVIGNKEDDKIKSEYKSSWKIEHKEEAKGARSSSKEYHYNHCKEKHFWSRKKPVDCSWIWKNILKCRIVKGFICSISCLWSLMVVSVEDTDKMEITGQKSNYESDNSEQPKIEELYSQLISQLEKVKKEKDALIVKLDVCEKEKHAAVRKLKLTKTELDKLKLDLTFTKQKLEVFLHGAKNIDKMLTMSKNGTDKRGL
ncbi:hypothetical protein GIB67_026401 [Kingdonia uniflora]|uniref:Uncharacterized protein n=1 Tax=Kingdonia uniflora TaxID=39325 RepID=A0A7J7P6H0_9MAGN|nr:hypothetical protein GIB67_026401 [Kingdonia uniflora]